jgi:hypothetical protein
VIINQNPQGFVLKLRKQTCSQTFLETQIETGYEYESEHKLRKRGDWTVRRIFLSLLIDHMMTKYIIVITYTGNYQKKLSKLVYAFISYKPPQNSTATVVNGRGSGP